MVTRAFLRVLFAFCILLEFTDLIEPGLIDSEWNKRNSTLSFQSLSEKYTSKPSDSLPNGITVVSAFFDIGRFEKGIGEYSSNRSISHYVEWMDFFKNLNNSVIVYTDSIEVEERIRRQRQDLPQTKIIRINRNTLWSFRIANRIKAIYSQPGYPKHPPNTVNELYPCAMHAKYELLNHVIQENLYSDKYLAWLDMGYFRSSVETPFKMDPLEEFDDNKIVFYEHNENRRTETPESIIAGNKVWVGGGTFIARPEVMKVFVEDYMKSVELLLDFNLMSTDQQVIYIMYSSDFKYRPRVEIQVYTDHWKNWFLLGENCRRLYWEKESKKRTVKAKSMEFFLRAL